ncbi:ABC-type transport auxiliary lipoprotein family protein [Maricaulis sp. D1M11]|uniref:ABC-type transport auxiliary lipoprotein family protein n=1 Tax=Maricaulis sp. D1M11 TaxID=3076117 RepID=UPI0039B4D874
MSRKLPLLRGLLMGLAALSVSACVSVLPEAEPVDIYRLSPPQPVEWSGDDWTVVRVDLPQAPRALANDHIAVIGETRSIAYLAGARWINTTPRMIQTLIVETLDSDATPLVPARPEDAVQTDFILRMDLREFEAVYDQGANRAPLVTVRIAARLMRSDDRSFVGGRVFTSTSRADGNSAGAIVRAFDQSSHEAANELAGWMAQHAMDTPSGS